MPTRRRSPRRSGVMKPKLAWTSSTLENFVQGAGSLSAVDALGQFTVGEKQNIRGVRRLLLKGSVRSSAAGSRATGRVGLVRITDSAMAAPTIPDPEIDEGANWMMNEWYYQEEGQNIPYLFNLDLKASRQLFGNEQTFALAIKAGTASTASVVISFSLRLLLTWK